MVSADAELVLFDVGTARCALETQRIVRVLRMLAITPLPKAPSIILGVFNYHGELLPVANTRARLSQPEHPVTTHDRLLVVQTRRRRLALVADVVHGVRSVPRSAISPREAVPGLELVRGIAKIGEEGIVFINDIDAFLSLDEEAQLTTAMSRTAP